MDSKFLRRGTRRPDVRSQGRRQHIGHVSPAMVAGIQNPCPVGERETAFASFRVPPESAEDYGSNCGFFSVDMSYLRCPRSIGATGRPVESAEQVRGTRKAPVQGAWDRGQYLRVAFRLGGTFRPAYTSTTRSGPGRSRNSATVGVRPRRRDPVR
jgi:hypothetical protein